MVEFNVQGNSGCDVFLKNGRVFKKAGHKKYSDRLYLQFEKQKSFSDSIITAPHILNSGNDSGLFWFEMEYIAYKHYDDYFSLCSVDDLDIFLENILSFIDRNITGIGSFKSSCLLNKYETVKSNIFKSCGMDINYLNSFFYEIDDIIQIPIGYHHGDLTMSNMLFDNNKIVLIDFLDSFIETPLNDVVKLRQDTRHFWSIGMTKKIYDIIKLKQSFLYLDDKIDCYFRSSKFYQNYYNYFQALNLLRIVPYCSNKKTVDGLLGEINLLCIR
jgi:hypothetical protein